MKIFKNIDETCPVSETSFKRTLACLANANWNRTYGLDNKLEYYGYSNKNMAKAIKAKTWSTSYSHYRMTFLTSRRAYIENNRSSGWFVVFDTAKECKTFKQSIFKKFFSRASR